MSYRKRWVKILWSKHIKKDIDRSLILENLKPSVEDRFRNAIALMRFADELRRAGRAARANRA